MIVTIVQARMGSTRLPCKVMRSILGRPMLYYVIERLRRVQRSDRLVVATTDSMLDAEIADYCAQQNIDCFRGSETDVLSRYYFAATQAKADTIVRVTSDCPLIDSDLVDTAIETFLKTSPRIDYLSNMLKPTWPYGMAVEVFTYSAIEEAHQRADKVAEREHVTPYIYWRPDRFPLYSMERVPDLSHHRWTVDTPEDFDLVTRIFNSLYDRKPDFALEDVLELLLKNPDWAAINQHVVQRKA